MRDLSAPAAGLGLVWRDDEIRACWPVMRELRPHLDESGFVARVRRQQQQGYRLLCARDTGVRAGACIALAGFRCGENLAWGRFLYVDDLVTRADRRSEGWGRRLLGWLGAWAVERGCTALHLDSGMQRVDAHRFYEREGLAGTGIHFARELAAGAD